MKKPTTIEKTLAVLNFFKEAFCVDGAVRFMSDKAYTIDAVVELNDSKRGTFYIASVSKEG